MTTLQKLHFIEQHKTIYSIRYCRAGVGFMFYDYNKTESTIPDNWKGLLVVEKYYETFEEAVRGEYDRL